MDQDHEPVSVMDVVAQRVRELRKSRGWSAQRLADELRAVGIEWERIVVSRLETGKRQALSVAELLGLSQVFQVSPVGLLLPEDDVPYRVTPNTTTSTRAVYEWIVGERLPPPSGPEGTDELTDEDRGRSWFVFEKMLPFVGGPSTNWLVNAELRQLREHDQHRMEQVESIQAGLERAREDLSRTAKELEGKLLAELMDKLKQEGLVVRTGNEGDDGDSR